MEDSGIIDLFFARDEKALQKTEEKYGPALRGYATRLVADEGDGNACVGDTYLEAWKSIPPTRPTYYAAFLYKILRHICLDLLAYRRAGKRSAHLTELTEELQACLPGDASVDAHLEGEQLASHMAAFLRLQSEIGRAMFLKRYFACLSVGEIARDAGVSEGAVKVTLHRMKKKLRTYLEKEGYTV